MWVDLLAGAVIRAIFMAIYETDSVPVEFGGPTTSYKRGFPCVALG